MYSVYISLNISILESQGPQVFKKFIIYKVCSHKFFIILNIDVQSLTMVISNIFNLIEIGKLESLVLVDGRPDIFTVIRTLDFL